MESEAIDSPVCRGFEFTAEGPIDYDALFQTLAFSGFQATNLGLAIEQINAMLHFQNTRVDVDEGEGDTAVYGVGAPAGVQTRARDCKIFLGVTSTLVSGGMREVIRFIVKHKMVDVVCVTAGGVEEDLIKCLAPTHLGDFDLRGANLRARGLSTFYSNSRSNRESDCSEPQLLSF